MAFNAGEIEATLKLRDEMSAQLRTASGNLDKFGKSTGGVTSSLSKFGAGARSAGMALTAGLTLPLVALAAGSLKAAIDFESSFTGVRKTVDATEAEFAKLSQGFRDMAKEIPISVNELNRIGEAAGQLGIKKENILDFTRTMADLGVTTNMAAEEAATALARFANITDMSQNNFDRLGATIVELGNNFATTEGEIVEMGLRLAGAGAQIGMSEAQIMGMAAALSSVGLQAQAGGTAFSKVMIEMATAVGTGGQKLEMFAATAGMTSESFAELFGENSAEAITQFVKGLGEVGEEGTEIFTVLEELGFSGIRVRDSMLRSAGASEKFALALDKATIAFAENTALTLEAEKRYATVASQLQILWNNVKDLAISLGEELIPHLINLVEWAKKLVPPIEAAVKWFSGLDSGGKAAAIGLLAAAAAIGPLLFLLGGLAQGMAAVITLAPAMAVAWGAITGPIGLTVIAVAAVVAGLGYLAVKAGKTGEVLAYMKDRVNDLVAPLKLLWDLFKALADGIAGLIPNFASLEGASGKASRAIIELIFPFPKLIRMLGSATAAARIFFESVGVLEDEDFAGALAQASAGVENFGAAVREAGPPTAAQAQAMWDLEEANRESANAARSNAAAILSIATEEQTDAIKELATYTLDYVDTLATVNAADQEMVETLLEHGASLDLIATAYPRLSTAQIKSVQEGMKAEEERVATLEAAQDEILSLQEEAQDAVLALEADTLSNRLVNINTQRRRDIEAATDSIETSREEAQAILAINTRYDALGLSQQRRAEAEALEIISDNADAAFDLQATSRERSLRDIQSNLEERLNIIRENTLASSDARERAEQAARDGSAASVAALAVDNRALVSNSIQAYEEIAAKAKATYELMAAHPEKYSEETIEAHRLIAEEAGRLGDEANVTWAKGFAGIANKIPGIITEAFTSGGGISGALKGVISMVGADVGKMVGDKLGTAFAALGAIAGPIGSAIGSLVGPIINAFIKMFDHTEKDLKRVVSRFGVNASKSVTDAIASTMKTEGLNQVAATVFNATKIFPTVDTTNIRQALRLTHDAFSMIETRQLTVAQGGKVVDDMFKKMASVATNATGLISAGLLDIIALNERFGTNSAEISKHITAQTTSAVKGLTTFVTAGGAAAISSQNAATALGSAITVSFLELLKQGMSTTEAIKAIGPLVDGFKQQLVATGFEGSAAFTGLTAMVDLASNEIAGPALEAVEGLNAAMKGLHNAGILDQEMFLGLSGQISSTFKTLVDQGAEGNTALMMMQPSLQTIWELQKDFGYAVDEGTQLLLDQAVTAGIVGAKHRSVEERVLAVLERIAEVLGADLPDAAREAERAAVAAADKIQHELNDIKLNKLILEAEAQVHWNYDAFDVPDITYNPDGGSDGVFASHGGLVTNSGIQTLAHGGMVRGYARGTDSVPALLTPGEAVLTTRAVGTLGTGAISQLNNGGSLSNADVIAELRALRKQQAASDRQLPLLVALSVRDAMQLQR